MAIEAQGKKVSKCPSEVDSSLRFDGRGAIPVGLFRWVDSRSNMCPGAAVARRWRSRYTYKRMDASGGDAQLWKALLPAHLHKEVSSR